MGIIGKITISGFEGNLQGTASFADNSSLLEGKSSTYFYDGYALKVVNQSASTVEIAPNVMNLWGEVATLTVTLAAPTDNVRTNEYVIQFTSPSSAATTFSYPNTIVWGESNATVEVGGVIVPNIEAGKTYQISIVNNKGIIGGF